MICQDHRSQKRSRDDTSSIQEPVIQILGDIFTDILALIPASGFKVGGDTLSKINVMAGGSGLNVCVHMAAYLKWRNASSKSSSATKRVAMFSCVGDDLHGKLCLDKLREAGVDTEGVCVSKHGNKTGSCIVLSSGLERSFVTDAACISDELALPLFLREDSTLYKSPACHFHVSGYYNLVQLRIAGGLREALSKAKEQGLPTSLNPQSDSMGLWNGIRNVAPVLDLLIANEEEVLQIANSNERDPSLEPRTSSLSKAAARLLSWGCGCVVATLGSRGATAFYRTTDEDFSPQPPHSPGAGGVSRRRGSITSTRSVAKQDALFVVELEVVGRRLDSAIVDTTGAGDAFTGAFIGALHATSAESEERQIFHLPFTETQVIAALQAGCEAGALACTVLGGSTVPLRMGSDN